MDPSWSRRTITLQNSRSSWSKKLKGGSTRLSHTRLSVVDDMEVQRYLDRCRVYRAFSKTFQVGFTSYTSVNQTFRTRDLNWLRWSSIRLKNSMPGARKNTVFEYADEFAICEIPLNCGQLNNQQRPALLKWRTSTMIMKTGHLKWILLAQNMWFLNWDQVVYIFYTSAFYMMVSSFQSRRDLRLCQPTHF